MADGEKRGDWQIECSIEIFHASKETIALTRLMIERSEEAVASSMEALKRTAHLRS